MGLEITSATRLSIIITFLLYTIVVLGIGLYVKKKMDKTSIDKYVDEFYTGGRGMGALVIALMIAAGMCSAGTFIGGPGLCYTIGFTFVLAGMGQSFLNFSILGELGKKIGIVARRINAHSFIDLLVSRYNNNKLIGLFGVGAIIVFFGSYVVAQFVGGARLFETMTGLPYWLGLTLFAVVVLMSAAFGGIKGVSATVVFQGFIMTVAVIALFIGALGFIGPLKTAFVNISKVNPSHISPWKFDLNGQISYWLLFGLSCIAVPHGVMGTLTYKDTRAMHKAISIGPLFVIAWGLVLSFIGAMAYSVFPKIPVADNVIPIMTLKVLPPWLAGITLAGVAGAIQSTVGAMIIVMSSTFVGNAYKSYINPNAGNDKLKKVTIMSTLVICLAVFLIALNPPKALQWIIIFAVSGMASAYFWPLLLGLYWMKANEHGASAGMIGGLATFIVFGAKLLPTPFGLHPFIMALIVSGVLIIVVSLITPKTPKGIIMTWFGEHYPKEIIE